MTDRGVTPDKVALSACATVGECSTWLGNRKHSLLGGQKQFAHPKQSSYNAKAVRHQCQSSSLVALKAVHQQRQKRLTSSAKSGTPAEVSIQALASSMSRRPATRNHQAAARSPTTESIRTLNTEALRLHLNTHNLATTSKHQELVERLLQ